MERKRAVMGSRRLYEGFDRLEISWTGWKKRHYLRRMTHQPNKASHCGVVKEMGYSARTL
jgi:hypothetical protein